MSIAVPSFASFPDFESQDDDKRKEPSSSKQRSREQDRAKDQTKSDKRHKRPRSKSPKRREKGKDRERTESRRERKDKHNDKDREDDRHRKRDGDRRREGSRNDQPDQPPDESYRLFYSDRRPDPLNVVYGGLHQADVPKYRISAGGRHILGLSNAYVIVRRLGKGIEIGLKNSKKMPNIADSRAKSLLALPPTRRLVGPQQSDKYQEHNGFIPIPSRRDKVSPDETYRSILSHEPGHSSDSESDGADWSEDDESESEGNGIHETSHQAHMRILEGRLAEAPDSIGTWLAVLEHSLSTIPVTSKNATKARCDISISILSRALSAHPSNRFSKVLLIKYLKAGEEIWTKDKLLEEWQNALKVGGIEIWLEWLEWRSRNPSAGFDSFVEDLRHALSIFGETEADQLAKLRIFWRGALAIRNAGFSERAMAMLQAQAELTFNIPVSILASPFEQQLDELESFWESEAPRVGEEGASGWGAWYQHSISTGPQPPASSVKAHEVMDLDPYRQWAAEESLGDRNNILPSRTNIETEEDFDPYSTILFSDIRTTLFKLNFPKAKHAFRLVFLSFLGLHIPGLPQHLSPDTALNWDDRWCLYGLASSDHLLNLFPREQLRPASLATSVAGVIVGHEQQYSDPFGPVKQWGFEVVQPLETSIRAGNVVLQQLWNSSDTKAVDATFIRRVFSQLRRPEGEFAWDALALAFEAALNIKSALKLSKALLSSRKDSMEYWTAHAQLERLNGKIDGARKVYQTVLVSPRPSNSQPTLSQMWWNWAEMEWLSGSVQQAMNVILQSVGIATASEVGVLRGKQALKEAVDSAQTSTERESWIKSQALLELLKGEDIIPALIVFDQHIATASDDTARQRLVVASLLFIYYYRVVLNKPMPPAILRDRATEALGKYPSNSIVLAVFLESEKGQGIWGRIRSTFVDSDKGDKDVLKLLQEVWLGGWEKGRWTSEIERIRSSLAAAVEQERTRASPIVWRLYLEFEIRTGQFRSAKKLLFRAIADCPFVKEMYLLAFGPLRSVFDGRELHNMGDLMAERGLRLRKALDDVVGTVERESDGDNNGEEIGIDEIEHNAQELRRLMPY